MSSYFVASDNGDVNESDSMLPLINFLLLIFEKKKFTSK